MNLVDRESRDEARSWAINYKQKYDELSYFHDRALVGLVQMNKRIGELEAHIANLKIELEFAMGLSGTRR